MTERDLMAVALFCLDRAREALTLVYIWERRPMPEFDDAERWVLKIDHVYKSCRLLAEDWPHVFPAAAREAAGAFVLSWQKGDGYQVCEACSPWLPADNEMRQIQAACISCKNEEQHCASCEERVCSEHAIFKYGKDLRNALAHIEEALANPTHRLRGEPVGYWTILGIKTAGSAYMMGGTMWARERGPIAVSLLGKTYRLRGVVDALAKLEREFSAVLIDPATGRPWRV